MKACRVCGRLYPDDAGFCPAEGQELYGVTELPVPSDDADARIGTTLRDRYQIRRVVADGGMGRVYEALDLSGQRNVAIKVLHPDISDDAVAVARFKREFAVSQKLPHAHIVEVTDFQATTDGSYALVMEFLYGEDLRATLKREKGITPARLVRLMSQVATGLDAAHERKLVHRDLKPDNLFLCRTTAGDIVKILDFGSVKDKGRGAKKLTLLGTTIGSPYYMSPEQAQGLDTLDRRADVWALGAIAYECLSGTVPFTGTNGPSILLQILSKQPEPPSVGARARGLVLPEEVDRAILGALTKSVKRRTATVGEFADQLGQAFGIEGSHQDWANLKESEIAARIARGTPRIAGAPAPSEAEPSRMWLVVVGVVLVAVVLGAVVAWLF